MSYLAALKQYELALIEYEKGLMSFQDVIEKWQVVFEYVAREAVEESFRKRLQDNEYLH